MYADEKEYAVRLRIVSNLLSERGFRSVGACGKSSMTMMYLLTNSIHTSYRHVS